MSFLASYHSSVLVVLAARGANPSISLPEFMVQHKALVDEMKLRWAAGGNTGELPSPDRVIETFDVPEPNSGDT